MRTAIRMIASNLAVATAFSALLMLSTPTVTHAATLVGTWNAPSGIDGLVIDGATYNVSFAQGTYGAVYSSNAPTFYGNSSGATDAVNALAAALASVDPPFLIQNFGVFIPVSDSAGQNSGEEVYLFNAATSYSTADYEYPDFAPATASDNFDFFSYTQFTEVSGVPEPSTWAMMILGFCGVGFMACRRKGAAPRWA